MPKYKRKQSSLASCAVKGEPFCAASMRKELLKTCKEWGGELMDTRKLLHLAKARADDAQKQFNEAQVQLRLGNKLLLESRTANTFNEYAAHLNMSAYEDALAHSKLNHALLTEASDTAAKWKRMWSEDRKFWWTRYQNQDETILALTEANKTLRAELEKYEKFHVVSKDLVRA